jgi:hypothetical protein
VLTSSTRDFGLIQSAFTAADNCPPGAGESTTEACGLAAGNVASALIGLGGVLISATLLVDAKSNVSDKTTKLNQERVTKLKRVVSTRTVNLVGLQLISRISSPSADNQKNLQSELSAMIPVVTGD